MKLIRSLVALSLLVAVVMAFMVLADAENAALAGQELNWSLFWGPMWPLGVGLLLTLLHTWLMTASGQRWRKFRNERKAALVRVSQAAKRDIEDRVAAGHAPSAHKLRSF